MFVCLFWSILLAFELRTDGRNRPRLHLFVFMLTATVLYFGHFVFFNRDTALMPVTDTLYCVANLAVYPLYYLYICSLSVRQYSFRRQWFILLPALCGGVAIGTLYVLMSPDEIGHFVNQYLYCGNREKLVGLVALQAYVHDICKVVFALLIIPVLVYGRIHIKEYDQQVKNAYADDDNKTLAIIHQMLSAFIIISALSFAANIIGRHQFASSSWLLAIPSTLFSIVLFMIGYIGYKQEFSIGDIEQDEQLADQSLPDSPNISKLHSRIEQLMEEEELFRRPNIKIADLVSLLNTNRNYIYQAINREMGISFCEYINQKRINYAALLIAQHPEMYLSEVAEQSGFSNNTSFYRNFKLYKGVGPKEFQCGLRNGTVNKSE